jgi:hypothetical protein
MKYLISLFALIILVTGCAGTLTRDVQSALVFEQQVGAEVANLKTISDADIPMLPADKQQAAREQLAINYARLTAALGAKDKLLQAALAASTSSVDVTAVVVEIVSALEEFIGLVQSFGASEAQLQPIKERAMSLKTRAVK